MKKGQLRKGGEMLNGRRSFRNTLNIKVPVLFTTLILVFMVLPGSVSIICSSSVSPILEGVPARWWDVNWTARRPITISNGGNPQNLKEYQMKFNISFYNGMSVNFSNIRFVQHDQSTGNNIELPYYIDNMIEGNIATVWVKVGTIRKDDDTVIYLYYGNANAENASNRSATFDIYSTFDSDLDEWIPGGSYPIVTL